MIAIKMYLVYLLSIATQLREIKNIASCVYILVVGWVHRTFLGVTAENSPQKWTVVHNTDNSTFITVTCIDSWCLQELLYKLYETEQHLLKVLCLKIFYWFIEKVIALLPRGNKK